MHHKSLLHLVFQNKWTPYLNETNKSFKVQILLNQVKNCIPVNNIDYSFEKHVERTKFSQRSILFE